MNPGDPSHDPDHSRPDLVPTHRRKRHSKPVSWAGLIESAALLGGLASIAGFLGGWNWIAELASHFRVQLSIAFALLTLLALATRASRWVTGLLILGVGINAGPVWWEARPRGRVASPADAHLRLMSINVLTSNRRADLVLDAVQRFDPEILLLMEVDARWMKDLEPLHSRFPHLLQEPRTDNFGIALLSKHPLKDARIEDFGDTGVPSVFATVPIAGREIHMAGTHPLPPANPDGARDRDRQLEALASWAASHRGTAVVTGDLNCTPWSPQFHRLVRDGDLSRSHPDWGLFASWQVGQPWLSLPLDHCLVSPDIAVRTLGVGPEIGSDHRPILVDLAIPPVR